MAKDIRLDVYIDDLMYMALKGRVGDMDRTISQHVRHLIRQDIAQALHEERNSETGREAGNEGED